jgi:glycosyltransferase involved in cell wall biosynthesis
MEKLSVVILTYNEERNIGRCIESVKNLGDEILVVDSFSNDQTESICRQHGVKFIQHVFEGYIEQKNYAMRAAAHDLVLSLDADEALSPQLFASIKKAVANRDADGYAMNRLTSYCGKWIYHSGWYPDTKLRLFDRTKGKWGGYNPHDRFEMNAGAVKKHLAGDILHYSYYTFDEHKKQVKRFADISAKALYEQGNRSGFLKLIYKPVARFFRTYFVKAGFLDGRAGFTIARMTAWASYLRYSQLLDLQKKHDN